MAAIPAGILDLLEYATVTDRTAVAYVSASLKSGDRAEIIDAHDALTTAVDSITERLERTCFHAQISYDTARRRHLHRIQPGRRGTPGRQRNLLDEQ